MNGDLDGIRREMVFSQSRDEVWRALTDPAALAEWMFPNDFEARAGHRFEFHAPPRPEAKFDGLVVRGEVLVCIPPGELEFSWIAGELDTRIRYRLEVFGGGTKVFFEQTGYTPRQKGARLGSEYGWGLMHEKLADLLSRGSAA